MMKRLIAILLCACTLFVTLPVIAAEETDSRLDEAIMLINMMEAIPDVESTDMTATATRAEFAVVLARMLRIDTTATASTRYFTDVPLSHWGNGAINALVDMKILSQPEDKIFRPSDPIIRTEAIKMVVCALGYQIYAESNGGYPYGYLAAAAEAKIMNGIGSGDTFTREEMLILSRNAMLAEVYEITSVWNGHPVYESSEDKTLLSIYWDTYEEDGYTEAIYGTSLTDKQATKGEVIIDGVSYLCGSQDVEKYLGQYVSFYYYKEDGEDKGELLYIAATSDNEVIEFTAEDFISYSSRTVTYFDEEKGKEMDFTLSGGDDAAKVIENGTLVTKDISLAFEVENGEYRAIDADGDGRFETVLIYDSVVLQVTSIDTSKEVVYAVDAAGKSYAIAQDPAKITRIQTADNPNAGLDVFARDAVIHLYNSANVVTVYVCNKTVTGTLEELTVGAQSTATVGSAVYPVSNALAEGTSLSLGNSYTYYLDRYGKIAFVGTGSVTGMTYAFLHKAMLKPGIDKRLFVRFYTEAEGMVETTDNGKLIVDGQKMDSGDALGRMNTHGINEVILVRRDEDGLLAEIDTRYRDDSESDYTLTLAYDAGEVRAQTTFIASAGFSRFGRMGTFNTANLRFIVPAGDILSQAEPKDITVGRTGGAKQDASYGNVKLYTVNPDDMYDRVALIFSEGASTDYKYHHMIERITTGLDDNGDTVKIVTTVGHEPGSYTVAADYVSTWDSMNIGIGDVIVPQFNSFGEISKADFVLHYTAGETVPIGIDVTHGVSNNGEDHAGHVMEKQGNVVVLSRYDDKNTAFETLRLESSFPIYVYDSSLRENQVYKGTVDDILAADAVGADNASSIIWYSTYSYVRGILVHKNGWDN